jgi:hypothetical protein
VDAAENRDRDEDPPNQKLNASHWRVQERQRNGEAEGLCGLKIDHERQSRWPLD